MIAPWLLGHPPGPAERELVVGRIGTGADIEVDDPRVRRDHARLRSVSPGRWRVLAMAGRVFIRETRVTAADLRDGESFVVGRTTVVVTPDLLAALIDGPDPGQGLAVELSQVSLEHAGTTLLKDVTLRIESGEMMAIIGPSGAGKSTLVRVLLGEYRPTRGRVLIGGRPVGVGLAGQIVRRQIRYVPQSESDDLYPRLRAAETLTFAAILRSPGGTSDRDVEHRVESALAWLGLVDQRDQLVGSLSGGQRRRVSIGVELVGHPRLLLLDEPTSGLDLGLDREIMRLLRALARDFHCTVVLVTHSASHVDECDRIVMMARGGRIRYVGPPGVALGRSGHRRWADWLVALDAETPRPAGRASKVRSVAAAPTPLGTPLAGFRAVAWRQLLLLVRRGPVSLAALGALPLLGAVIAALASDPGLRGASATSAIAVLAIVSGLTGAALSYQDIVGEQAVLRRDWRVGVPPATLLWSKAAVAAAICVVLAAVMSVVYAIGRDLPRWRFGPPPGVAVFLVLLATMLASVGLGLLISSGSPSRERAVTWNTVLAVGQVALSGAMFPLPFALHLLTPLIPSRLGVAALASYSALNPARHASGGYTDPLWRGDPVAFWLLLLAEIVLFATATAVGGWLTGRSWSRTGPGRPPGV